MKSKILIGNISSETTEAVIRELLAKKIGNVLSVAIPQDPKTKKHRGYAIVEMTNDSQSDKAIDELNGFCLDGRALAITLQEKTNDNRKWYQRKS